MRSVNEIVAFSKGNWDTLKWRKMIDELNVFYLGAVKNDLGQSNCRILKSTIAKGRIDEST